MAHKVHPKAFRLKEITDWDSRGFYQKGMPQYLEDDFKIREFLKKKIGKLGVERIKIERFAGKINVIISSARPGLIIGRGGGGVEELKKDLGNKIIKNKTEVRIEIREIKDPWASAPLAAQWITQQIEKRVRYRRVLKQALDKIMVRKGVEGCRVEVAGRLDGKEIARTEWLKKGRLPRQTLRADIDYAQARAYCTYGVVGVKVWIYKGERFA
ncbi:MAG: 30S ribosomal protein S3 [Candidatus Nealsonbacteria bacterium CG10_big_fil_rev_8_21_14_0_10_36_228]|uniref:Small ribosomal subunit protein uS3 n=2 Tax=Candidatus Nealsoniibacteriota TaxID=1817911 RepID=A0A2H0TKJ4_9BACT|nr:MAG: 30S ribosomal protein S3 [Candidatus Nealsonbacteria bacterium CG23_combo_of_CG06-09_8_20_14_all_36_125]PIR72488.1 MAG: 30S ribosomal protein S3 [Candidatus Nealsonbacteria bacterium CG10_big_fil_rev_8_21_14_0_10_36_228]